MHVPSGCSKLDTTVIIDKVKGLFFGAILGDSLGLATEGMSRSDINEAYGEGPIRFGMDEDGATFFRSNIEENDFGDDAEQMIIVMESIIGSGGHFNSKDFASRLHSYSQQGIHGLNKPPACMNAINEAVLAKENFKTSPQGAAIEVWKEKNLKGTNGAIVRAPILGALKFWDGTTVIENTTACCRITHPDPRCMISCVIISTLIARLLRGQDLEQDINDSTTIPTPIQSPPATSRSHFIDRLGVDSQLQALVQKVVEANKPMLFAPQTDPLFVTPETDMDQMKKYYGQLLDCCVPSSLDELELYNMDRRDSFKCLSAAIYCLTRKVPLQCETEYFKRMLMDIVMQGNEADINATAAGAMLGARFGYSCLPTEWVVGTRRWEWLEDVIEEFCAAL